MGGKSLFPLQKRDGIRCLDAGCPRCEGEKASLTRAGRNAGMAGNFAVLDAVVVGAGQAGLGVSYYLARAGVAHRVLERGRIGECWRTHRWDAFLMNSVNAQTVMTGQRYDGP